MGFSEFRKGSVGLQHSRRCICRDLCEEAGKDSRQHIARGCAGVYGIPGRGRASELLQRRLTPEHLATLNLKRNRKKSMLTMCSLVLAGILLGTITSFVVSYDPASAVDNFIQMENFSYSFLQNQDFQIMTAALRGGQRHIRPFRRKAFWEKT